MEQDRVRRTKQQIARHRVELEELKFGKTRIYEIRGLVEVETTPGHIACLEAGIAAYEATLPKHIVKKPA